MGRARLADQYERRAGRQRRRRCRGRHFLSGLQLDRERPEQRDERLDHLGNEVNLKLPAILALFSLTLGAPGVAAQWSVSAELGVARFGAGLKARVAAGPAFDLWNFDGEQRNRVGGRATAVVEWPLARALMGSLRVSGVWSGSVLDPGDAPSGVERRATRRFGVALGLRYQL